MSDHDELARLEAAATPGPWEVDAGGGGIVFSASVDEFDVEPYNLDVYGDKWRQDAAFIVALRNAAPTLLAAAARQADLERENADLKASLDRWVIGRSESISLDLAALAASQAKWKAIAERLANGLNIHSRNDGCQACEATVATFRALAAEEADSDG